VFDLDGTLIDTDAGYRRRLFDRIGDRLDYRFTDREVDTVWYGLGDGRKQCLRAVGIDPSRFWAVFHEVEEPTARAEATYLFDDAARLVALNGPLGLVTHCQRYLTDPVLEALGIADWFDAVVCCSDAIGWKPAAEPVERAMAEMGVDASTARGVMVGDDPYDTGAAWNAGLESVHVQRYDPDARGRCVLGDRRIGSLWELGT
jgi:phosphoglycolate phosphatase